MSGTDARVIQVIETNLTTRGTGTKDSPYRRVKEYWSMDGEKLAEFDIDPPTCCNAVGHRLMPKARECSHCGATLSDIVRAAGGLL